MTASKFFGTLLAIVIGVVIGNLITLFIAFKIFENMIEDIF